MKKRKKLTVSEAAKLLGINPHTIRYYDKEGLLNSESDKDTGYRLFDHDALLRLSNIMLLRDSNIPIKDIKKLVDNYDTSTYEAYLKNSLDNIDNQITKLNLQRKRVLENLSSLKVKDDTIEVKNLPEKKLKCYSVHSYTDDYTALDYYSDSLNGTLKNILYKKLYYRLLEDSIEYLMECSEDPDIILQSGEYLVYETHAADDNELSIKVSDFMTKAYNKGYYSYSEIFLELPHDAMLVSNSGYIAKIFIKV